MSSALSATESATATSLEPSTSVTSAEQPTASATSSAAISTSVPASNPPTSSAPDPSSSPPLPTDFSTVPPPSSSSVTTPSSSESVPSPSSPVPPPSSTSQEPSSSIGNVPPSQTSSAPPSSSTTPPPTSTSTGVSTFVTTDSSGQTFTSTRVITSVVTPTTLDGNTNTRTSSSSTGAIVGGVLGSAAGIAILSVLLLWWFRRKNHKEDFDGNFDPDRIVSDGRHQGDLDLVGHEVTPYDHGAPNKPQMTQQHSVPSFLADTGVVAGPAGNGNAPHTQRNYLPGPSSIDGTSAPSMHSQLLSDPAFTAYDARASSHGHTNSIGGASSPTNPSHVMPGPSGDFRHPSPGPSFLMGSESSTSSPPGAGAISSQKEIEAYQQERFRIANANAEGPVIVHQDGGRLGSTPEEENPPNEIPPTYDSIRRD